jgi:hypothetical protein
MLHRTDANYRFAYLAYLANGTAYREDTRMIWADIALDMLRRSETRKRQHQDFRRFRPEALATSGLDAIRQQEWRQYWAGKLST